MHRWGNKNKPARSNGEKIKKLVWDKTAGSCWYCGRDFQAFSEMHIDHQVPISRGGRNELWNLFPACWGCNMDKGTKDLEKFRAHVVDGYLNTIDEAREVIERFLDENDEDSKRLIQLINRFSEEMKSGGCLFYGESLESRKVLDFCI